MNWEKEFEKTRYDPICIKEGLYLTLTDMVSKRMNEKNWSYKELAVVLDVKEDWLNKFFKGEADIDLGMVIRICSILHIEIDFSLPQEKK